MEMIFLKSCKLDLNVLNCRMFMMSSCFVFVCVLCLINALILKELMESAGRSVHEILMVEDPS